MRQDRMTTHFVSNKMFNYWPLPASPASPQEPPSIRYRARWQLILWVINRLITGLHQPLWPLRRYLHLYSTGQDDSLFVSNKTINYWPPPASLASPQGPPSIRYRAGWQFILWVINQLITGLHQPLWPLCRNLHLYGTGQDDTLFVSNKTINYWPPPASLASPQGPPSIWYRAGWQLILWVIKCLITGLHQPLWPLRRNLHQYGTGQDDNSFCE